MPFADYSTMNSLWFYHLSQNFFSKIFFCCAVITEEEELFLRICCHGNVAASVHIIYNDKNFLVFLLCDREDDGEKRISLPLRLQQWSGSFTEKKVEEKKFSLSMQSKEFLKEND